MQIHELTKKQLNEADPVGPSGLANRVKTAYQAAKQPGALGSLVKSQQSAAPNASLWQRAKTALASNPLTSTAALSQSSFAKNMQSMQTNTAFNQVAKNLQNSWEQRRTAQRDVAAKTGRPMTYQTMDALIDDWYETTVIPVALRSERAKYTTPSGGPAPAKIVSTLQKIKDAEKLPDAERIKAQSAEIKNLAVATSAMSQLLMQQKPQLARAAGASAPKTGAVDDAQITLAKAASLSPSQLAAIEKIVGALPAVTSRDPNTINYLKALGFDVQ